METHSSRTIYTAHDSHLYIFGEQDGDHFTFDVTNTKSNARTDIYYSWSNGQLATATPEPSN